MFQVSHYVFFFLNKNYVNFFFLILKFENLQIFYLYFLNYDIKLLFLSNDIKLHLLKEKKGLKWIFDCPLSFILPNSFWMPDLGLFKHILESWWIDQIKKFIKKLTKWVKIESKKFTYVKKLKLSKMEINNDIKRKKVNLFWLFVTTVWA